MNLARLEVLCSEGRNLALLPHCAIQAYPYRAGERAESTACTLRSKAMRPVSQTVDDSRANARSRCRSRSAIFGGRTRIPFTMEPYGKFQTPHNSESREPIPFKFSHYVHTERHCQIPKLGTNYPQGYRGFQETPNNFLKISVPWLSEPSCLGPPCQNVLRVSMFSTSLPNLVTLTRRAAEKNGVLQEFLTPNISVPPNRIFVQRRISNMVYLLYAREELLGNSQGGF